MIEINHRDRDKDKILVHAFSVTAGNDYTLCGEDSVGDSDREILDTNCHKKITCKSCIEIIWGVHKAYALDDCDIAEVAKNKRLLKIYNISS